MGKEQETLCTSVDRAKAALNVRSNHALAMELGVSLAVIYDFHRSGYNGELLDMLREKGINPDWIVTGQGPVSIN